jgi:lipopolysaccharide export system permease protein
MRNRRIQLALLLEMLPSFILGLAVFLIIILMFQILRLTEFALIHGVSFFTLAEIIFYICISMLPALLPMSLLFSILWTYNRLSMDSEILALRACGLSMPPIMGPALILSLAVGLFSAQTSFELAPWGNRQFEVLFSNMKQTKSAGTIRQGTFSEGLFDLVVYANRIDAETDRMEDVFIYDERDPKQPLTIIAKYGLLQRDESLPGHKAILILQKGSIHRQAQAHTKINFDSFDVRLNDPLEIREREKSAPSWTLEDILLKLKEPLPPKEMIRVKIEWHKRMAIAVLCFVFGLLGVGLGIQTNKRTAKSSGFIISLMVIVSYWVIYISVEGLARSGQIPPGIALWLPNIAFGLFGIYSIRKIWN